jgi:ABC-type amino acid transport substrate-binding protein
MTMACIQSRLHVKKNDKYVRQQKNIFMTHPCSVVMLLLVIFLSSAVGSVAQTVEIITFAYPPYKTNDGTGLADKIITAALQTQRRSVEFRVYPLRRAIHNFRMGEGQLFLGLPSYFSELEIEATEIVYYSRVLVYLKAKYPTLEIKSLDELKGKTVGVLMGASVSSMLESSGLIVEMAPGNENNIKKLRSERVDFVSMVDLSAIGQINQSFPGELADFGFYEFDRAALALIARKESQSETLFQAFRRGIKAIIENGTYHQIFEEFYGQGQVPVSVQIDGLQ